MAAARELVIADEPAAWEALGFAVREDGAFALGALWVRLAGRGAGRGVVALSVADLAAERPDGLPLVRAAAAPAAPAPVAPGTADASAPATAGASTPATLATADATAPATAGAPTPATLATADASAPGRASSQPNGATAIDHLVAFTDDVDRTAGALAAAGGDVRRRGGPPQLPAPMAFVRFGPLIVEVAQTGGPARFWGLTVAVADLDALAGPLLGSIRPAVQAGRRIASVRREAGLGVALAFMSQDSNPPAPPRDSTNAGGSGTVARR